MDDWYTSSNSTTSYLRDYQYKIIKDIENSINNIYYDTGTGTGSLAWKEYDAFGTGDKYLIENITNTATTYYRDYGDQLADLCRKHGKKITWEAPDPAERMRQMIRSRMAPAFHRSRKVMPMEIDEREARARQTLRRVIGEQAFKKFMRDGFITVVPKSGLTYRIYPGHGITEVYDRGIMVDRLCVVLQGRFPPTDSILMRYLLILNDEGEFSKYAVKHTVWQNDGTKKLVFPAAEAKPLIEEWARLKVA